LEIFRFDPKELKMKLEVSHQNVVRASQEFQDEGAKDFAELGVPDLQSACSVARALQ
jgi:hypothetical protein